jgi:hypothetical protein
VDFNDKRSILEDGARLEGEIPSFKQILLTDIEMNSDPSGRNAITNRGSG